MLFYIYIGASVVRRPATLDLDPGFPNLNHFASYVNAKKPLSVSRVLSLEINDFHNNTRTYLMYAQSYALVHWGLHANGGRHRDAFLDYVRLCISGKSSPTTFKKALGVDRKFEERWKIYAHQVLGG